MLRDLPTVPQLISGRSGPGGGVEGQGPWVAGAGDREVSPREGQSSP